MSAAASTVPRAGTHPHAATAVRAAPATDIAPPVTPNLVRADEVVTEIGEQGRAAEGAERRGVLHEMQRDRDRIDAGEAQAALRLPA